MLGVEACRPGISVPDIYDGQGISKAYRDLLSRVVVVRL